MTQQYLSLRPKASLIFANTNRIVISAKRRLQRTKARAEAETEILKKGPAGYRIALTNQCSEMGYVEKLFQGIGIQEIDHPGNLRKQNYYNKILKPNLAGRLASSQTFLNRHRPSKHLSLGTMESAPKINIGIPQEQREEIAAGLSRLLADTYVLYGKTHGFHWNVTGPMFNTLHLMFMDQYTELWNSLDVIAERVRALGIVAPYGGATLARLASIKEVSQPPSALDMVRELVAGHEAVARTARSIFPSAEDARDEPTADLLTQRLQIHEKTAWMLRSLLED